MRQEVCVFVISSHRTQPHSRYSYSILESHSYGVRVSGVKVYTLYSTVHRRG